jgi:hypothetical protein
MDNINGGVGEKSLQASNGTTVETYHVSTGPSVREEDDAAAGATGARLPAGFAQQAGVEQCFESQPWQQHDRRSGPAGLA